MENAVRDSIPRREAVELIRSKCRDRLETEWIPLEKACGRVAAEDICSTLNLPAVPCSRWDGISFSYDRYLACGGEVKGWQEERDYRRTNTGIGIFRDDFDTMVKIEDTRFQNGQLVSICQKEPVERGQNVIPVGERMAQGEVLVPRDTRLSPSHLNRLASGGNLVVPVYRKPVVALLPTGDELVACGETPLPGQTIESNTYSMRAKVELWGGRALIWPILKDNTQVLQQQLRQAAAVADLVVIGGGSGRGERDLLQFAIEGIGQLYFSSVAHGPGKRTCFAVVDGTPVVGLVGPPGGEEMTFDFYVMPAIRRLLRQEHRESVVPVILDEDVPPHHRVDFYFTMELSRGEDGRIHGRPLPHSDLDRNIALHTGYLHVPKKSDGFRKGEQVWAELRIGFENL